MVRSIAIKQRVEMPSFFFLYCFIRYYSWAYFCFCFLFYFS
ncbi:MAG: hypothetical protein H6925_06485 [Holosporaceae bacterium]|nr:MAG: hypothetical protein H6925_06485 [Holosporaceae bacterium]